MLTVLEKLVRNPKSDCTGLTSLQSDVGAEGRIIAVSVE